MKTVGIIATAMALLLLTGIASLQVWNANPTFGWRAFEQQFPGVLQQAGVRTLGSRSEACVQVALPLALRIRQSLTPQPQPTLVVGFPDSVQHFTLESVQNRCRMECLVRYSHGAVARIVLHYPSAAKAEAVKLRDGLRQISDTMMVSLYEATGI